MKKYFLILLLLSSLEQAKADGLGLGLPDVVVETSPEVVLPVYSQRTLIPITFILNEHEVISTRGNWYRIGLMKGLRDGLRNAGLNPVLKGNYNVTNVTIMTKSERGQGLIRLCIIDRPDHHDSACKLISEYQLSNYPNEFHDPHSWLTIPLFSSLKGPINEFPLEIEILGNVKIKNITVIVEPLVTHNPIPSPHPLPPIDSDPTHHIPPFLTGKSIMYNSGNVQIGEDKDLGRSHTELTMHNRNYVFADYVWIDVKALRNDAVINRIIVNCLDLRGYRFSEALLNGRGNSDGYHVQKNRALSYELPRSCKYVESVQVFGLSPNGLERKADIRVMLY